MSVSARLGGTYLDIATAPAPGRASPLPTVIARHALAPPGAGATIRHDVHVTALEQAALAASTTARPHRSKQRLPPSAAARAHAATLRTRHAGHDQAEHVEAGVVDLSVYAAAAAGRNTLTPPLEPGTPNPPKETNTP